MPPLTKELEEIQTDQSAGPPRQTGPCVMVIFGATGDLTARKLFPALYNLAKSNMLSREFAVVGFAKNEYSTDEFRKLMGQNLDNFATEKVDPDLKEWLLKRLYYVSGSFTDRESYQRLAQTLAEVDKNHNTHGNYFFYLATSPVFFADIVDLLGSTGLAVEKDGQWRRIVFEKPFGNDLESARHLNEQIKKTLSEHQIFRIDHYLGKETVQNILVFRFSNGIFEPIWNHRFIDHVQITVAETVGVEKRGGYFDMAGTLRDMVPNHLFQLLSLTTMEPPISFSSDAVHDEQAKILHAVQPLSAEDVLHCAVRGQYGEGEINGERLPAYRSEPGVPPDSKTETFVAMRLVIDNWRWAGVPFYLRTGKRLARRATEVAIQFKRAPFVLFRDTPVNSLKPNQLVIHIAPDEGISLRFGAKIPGPTMQLQEVDMNFQYGQSFGPNSQSDAYERLLLDAMLGDGTLFTRADEVEEQWLLVDAIVAAWQRDRPAFPNYAAGTWGPPSSEELLHRDGRSWRRH